MKIELLNITRWSTIFSDKTKAILYYGTILFIICFSFLFYAPCNYSFFNSDHAIHVLMAKSFQLPRDYYYWGQGRLGSLLPMTAYLLGKIIQIHPIYICSLVLYIFLFVGYYFLSRALNSYFLKIALCALIFLPVNEYHYLIFVGHPYSSQLFSGCLFILFLSWLKKYLLKNESFGFNKLFISILLCAGAAIFFAVGIWVSEFNAILLLIPSIYICFEKQLRSYILFHLKNIWFNLLGLSSIIFLFAGYAFYKQAKLSAAAVADSNYNKMFLDNIEDITKNMGFFMDKLFDTLSFNNNVPLENFFNWFLIVLSCIVIHQKILTNTPPPITK